MQPPYPNTHHTNPSYTYPTAEYDYPLMTSSRASFPVPPLPAHTYTPSQSQSQFATTATYNNPHPHSQYYTQPALGLPMTPAHTLPTQSGLRYPSGDVHQQPTDYRGYEYQRVGYGDQWVAHKVGQQVVPGYKGGRDSAIMQGMGGYQYGSNEYSAYQQPANQGYLYHQQVVKQEPRLTYPAQHAYEGEYYSPSGNGVELGVQINYAMHSSAYSHHGQGQARYSVPPLPVGGAYEYEDERITRSAHSQYRYVEARVDDGQAGRGDGLGVEDGVVQVGGGYFENEIPQVGGTYSELDGLPLPPLPTQPIQPIQPIQPAKPSPISTLQTSTPTNTSDPNPTAFQPAPGAGWDTTPPQDDRTGKVGARHAGRYSIDRLPPKIKPSEPVGYTEVTWMEAEVFEASEEGGRKRAVEEEREGVRVVQALEGAKVVARGGKRQREDDDEPSIIGDGSDLVLPPTQQTSQFRHFTAAAVIQTESRADRLELKLSSRKKAKHTRINLPAARHDNLMSQAERSSAVHNATKNNNLMSYDALLRTLDSMVKIGSKSISLGELYITMSNLGGYNHINTKNMWDTVCLFSAIHLDSESTSFETASGLFTTTDSAIVLAHVYRRDVLQYESALNSAMANPEMASLIKERFSHSRVGALKGLEWEKKNGASSGTPSQSSSSTFMASEFPTSATPQQRTSEDIARRDAEIIASLLLSPVALPTNDIPMRKPHSISPPTEQRLGLFISPAVMTTSPEKVSPSKKTVTSSNSMAIEGPSDTSNQTTNQISTERGPFGNAGYPSFGSADFKAVFCGPQGGVGEMRDGSNEVGFDVQIVYC